MRSMVVLLGGLLLVAGVARAETIDGCKKKPKLRAQAGCLLKVEKPEAIAALLEVAKQVYEQDTIRKKDGRLGIGARQDLLYAAENAGVIAAKTSEASIYPLLKNKDKWTQVFALRALGHALSILKMGYAKGGKVDDQRHAAIKDKVAKACMKKFRGKDLEIVTEAATCVGHTRDNKYAKALVGLLVKARAAKIQVGVYTALRKLPQLSQRARELRPLAKVLGRPMPKKWSTADVSIRGDICGLLALYANHGDTWAKKPAQKAVKAIGTRNSQAKRKCERLLNRI